MIRIATNTPFGFVLELKNDTPYYSEEPYSLYLNETLYGEYNTNMVSVFGLQPDTSYTIRVKTNEKIHLLSMRTMQVGYVIDIRDYNATGDGVNNDTSAINTAIYMAPKGAVIRFPKGEYLVNQILLKSDTSLYFEQGCVIKHNTTRTELAIIKGFQKDRNHEQATVNASWEGNPLDAYCGIFMGYNIDNVKIYGNGIIDGNGKEGDWWENPKAKNIAYRPKNVFLNKCSNIILAGFTSRNSASWNIHPFYCENIEIYNLSLQSEKNSPNTDGINPESCKQVTIAGCHFDVGDDCIAIKSGKYFMSHFDYQPCKDINISNCYMGSGHGGIAMGSEISCGIRRLYISKCYMEGTDRGIRIKTRRGRGSGSILSEIKLSNIYMKEVNHGIAINMFYSCDPDGKSDYVQSRESLKRDRFTPEIHNVTIDKVTLDNIHGCGIFMYGLPESHIDNVTIQNSSFIFSNRRTCDIPEMLENFEPIDKLGVFIKNAENIVFSKNQYRGDYISVIGEEVNSESN
ncbi:MAG: glycoside hydrolase family 28 protein [Suipraeoptans sp.]